MRFADLELVAVGLACLITWIVIPDWIAIQVIRQEIGRAHV